MITRPLLETAIMAGGSLNHSKFNKLMIRGISRDTRTLQNGQLYIPLIREQNGHHYVEKAFQLGAAASLWQVGQPSPPDDMPLIYVDDTLLALQRLAVRYREQLSTYTIAVTGSSGKTTTREMIASVINTRYFAHQTEGNLNNHYGLPLTLLQMDEKTDYAILEMGMNAPGEIALLSSLGRPNLAVITMIGDAHIETMGGREGIAKAKMEIVKGLDPQGTLVYPGDEPLLQPLISELRQTMPSVSLIPFGVSENNTIRLLQSQVELGNTTFTVNTGDGLHTFTIPLTGEHYAHNALSAIAIGRLLQLPVSVIASGLAAMKSTDMRMEVLQGRTGATLINDAFNANPSSMKAALKVLNSLQGFPRKWVVLGDMLELGKDTERYHREIGKGLTGINLTGLLTVGNYAHFITEEAVAHSNIAKGMAKHFSSKSDLVQTLASHLQPGDLVLFKGSRGVELDKIIEKLV